MFWVLNPQFFDTVLTLSSSCRAAGNYNLSLLPRVFQNLRVLEFEDQVKKMYVCEYNWAAPINSRLNVVVRSPIPFGLGRNGCWPSRGFQSPRAFPFIFSLCCPLNDRRRAAHSFFKIGRLFSFSPALLRLLILLLLLMSGNVQRNPGPIFPCFVCTGNVIWRGKSVQCCTCSKWVHLRCSQLSLSKFRALGSSHSWSCPLCRNTVTPSSDSSDMYTSIVQSDPSTDAALSPHPRLQTSYPASAYYISPFSAPSPPSLAPGRPTTRPASSPPPNSLTVLQWNAAGLWARSTELVHFLSSHPVDLICVQESNLNSSSSFWILCSAFWLHPLPVWHSLSWCHAR